MKKFALGMMTIGAMFFATQNLQAQEEGEVEEIEVETEIETEVEVQEEFTSVDVSELPQAVTEALMTDYNEATAAEAWVKTKEGKKVYKLKIDVNGEMKKLFIDEEGKWIEMEYKKSSEEK